MINVSIKNIAVLCQTDQGVLVRKRNNNKIVMCKVDFDSRISFCKAD